MTKTFKQAVEEIVRNRVCSVCSARHGCSTYVMNANSVCCAAFRDAEKDILAAHNAELDRIAKGRKFYVPIDKVIENRVKIIREHDSEYVGTPTELEDELVIALQAYIQAQKGS